MYYRINKFAVETFVRYLRRVFRYNNAWTNQGLEIVNVSEGKEQLAFEQYFEENEKYPVITVGSQGGTFTKLAFNDHILMTANSTYDLGVRSHIGVDVSDTAPLIVQLPTGVYTKTINAVSVYMAWTGELVGGDNITVTLYKNYQTTPVAVSSGSIEGTTVTRYDENYAELYPSVELVDSDYWLEFQTDSGSVYSFGIDEDQTSLYAYGTGSVVASGSMAGSVYYPASMKIGSMYDGSLVIRCQSKNDTSKAYTLSELVSQYVMLAKHAQLNRSTTSTADGMRLGLLNAGTIPEFTDKGIYIRDVRVGAVEVRKRGENDNIFNISVTVDYNTEWYEEFTAETIKEIIPEITEFQLFG